MFSYIKGILAEKAADHAVVECGGMGFKIYTSNNSLSDAKCVQGTEVTFYTYLYIKEGIMDLYGFSSKEELELFEMLISVSGVGAKGATAILSSGKPSSVALSIVTGDAAAIKKAPGIGNKTAQRIILELKDKIRNEEIVSSGTDAFESSIPIASNEREEAVNALTALGYTPGEAKTAVSKVTADINDVEGIIKEALRRLM